MVSFFFWTFLHFFLLVVFHWSLRDNKSSQVSRTFISFLADLNNAMICIVLVLLLTSSFLQSLFQTFGDCPKCKNYSLFCSLARSKYMSAIFFSFCGLLEWQNPLDDKFSLVNIRPGLLFRIIFESHWEFYGSHFLGQILICVYITWLHDQILSLAQFLVNHLSHPVMSALVFLLFQFAAFAYYYFFYYYLWVFTWVLTWI